MFILPVTTFRDNQMPTICFDKFDDITNFHLQILAYIVLFGDACAWKGD
jgi:hypothetical protein